MALTNEQMELLHAWVDGETTTAEGEVAQQLATHDADARLYVQELKRLRHLLLTHGCVNAPPGLRDRVCAALHGEFEAPVIYLPGFAWRTAIVAAAAAVVVSLALVFGPFFNGAHEGADHTARAPDKHEAPAERGPGSEPFGGAVDVRGKKRPGQWSGADGGNGTPDNSGADPKGSLPPGDKTVDPNKPPRPPALETQGRADAAAAVLSLDRGVDEPYELSVNMNRSRNASVLQVCNDMLLVSSMYGSARITDHDVEASDARKVLTDEVDAEEDDFAGSDFSSLDGVEVELDADQVPELLAALKRLTSEQEYGEVIVPRDLRKSMGATDRAVEELQEIAHDLEALARDESPEKMVTRSDSATGARGYLPPDIQRECVRRDAHELGEVERLKEVHDALRRNEATTEDKPPATASIERAKQPAESRKIRLVIRLR